MGKGAFYGNETPISPPRARILQSPSKTRGASRDTSGEANLLVGLSRDSMMLYSSQLMDRGLLTDEALCEEASRVLASKGKKPLAGEGLGGELEGLLQDLDGCQWDDGCWRGLANSWASPRKVLKAKS
ncbi:hypothetical protein CK203_004870 [Vitis vinifera]|uniref:Uncharacterized protein n=1 Tax=Vitis vinifera TaxID=29760 RepID=A0A438KGI1_VITVI|nr:hypothetical protein CK203_004870 [Vitis vinifera]